MMFFVTFVRFRLRQSRPSAARIVQAPQVKMVEEESTVSDSFTCKVCDSMISSWNLSELEVYKGKSH